MTLPGVNSLVSLPGDISATNSAKDLSYPPPHPTDTSAIHPQAKIDTSRLLNSIQVTHNTQLPHSLNTQLIEQRKQQRNTILPKINSPFLVTTQHRSQQLGRGVKKCAVRSNAHRNTKDCPLTEFPHAHHTLVEWLTEFRLKLGLDLTPVRYPPPSPPLSHLLDSLSDEEETRCYCVPNPDSPLDPYDLILTEYQSASTVGRSCYYSASPSSILAFDEEGLSGVTSVGRWVWERGAFYSLRRLRFFRQARERKVFRAWTKFHSQTKMQRVKKSLIHKLYILRPDYQQLLTEMLLYLHTICPISSLFYSQPLSVLREQHLKMFWLDLLQTKSMSELRTAVSEHFVSVSRRVEEVKERLVGMLVEFAEQMGRKQVFRTQEDTPNQSNFSDVILNRKRLQDFSFFIKLSDLLLHQHLRELCLIGAATFFSILQTSVQDAQHESTYGDEEQFRVMVLAIRKNRVKMSGQLQDISHGILAVAETENSLKEGGLVSRRHTQPNLDTKPEMLLHKILEKMPAGIINLVDELKGPSPALLRVTLQLVNAETTSYSPADVRTSQKPPPGSYRMRLEPSRDEICDFISDIHSELWRMASEYSSITEHASMEKYMRWFFTTSLCDVPPFSNSSRPPVQSPEPSTSLLPLLDKITPSRVNEFVESTHSISHSSHSPTYRLRPGLSSIVKRGEKNLSKRVRIDIDQEIRDKIAPTQRTGELDNFEKSLVEYWETTSSCMEENLEDISLYCDSYQHYCLILDYCVMVLAQTANPSETWGPEKLGHYLSFAESQEDCVNLMVQSFRSGALRVDTIDLYRTCKPFPELIMRDLTEHIRKIQNDAMMQFTEKIKYANFQLQLTINDVGSCANHLYFLDHMQQELERIQDAYNRMNSYYKIIQDYQLEYPDEDRAQLLAIHPWYNMMLSAVAEAELKKESTIKLFSDLISSSLNETCREMEQLKLSVSSRRFLEESSGYEPVYLDLSRYKREVDHLLTQAAELQRYGQQLLYQKGILLKNKNKKDQHAADPVSFAGEKLNNLHNELREILCEINLKQLVWSTWKKWKDLSASWYQLELSKLDTADIHKYMSYFNQMDIVFKNGLPQNSLWKSVREEFSSFEEMLPVLTCVTGPAIQERHWSVINKLLKQEIDIQQMTLEEFLKLDLLSKKERILQEALIAVQEKHSEELFSKVTDLWSTFKLPTMNKDGLWILIDVEDLLALIEDSIINLNLIKSSKYLGPIKKEVESWDLSLCQMLATIKTWYRFQQRWSELEAIFSSIDIRHDLALIIRDFKHVDKSFHEFSLKYISSREVNAMKIATSPGILESFQSHIVQLERVSRSLDDYLDNKRTSFPRFYFLSREELLEVIFNSSDTSIVNPYLSKLFGSVHQLQLISGYNPDVSNIHGVVSKEGEVLKLERLVPAKNTSSKWWIANLMLSLKEKVCYSICEAHSFYEQTILEDWVYGQFSGQAILVSLFITWTLEVEKEISIPSADPSTGIRSLCTLRNSWQQMIHRIANSFSNKKYSHLQLGMNIITVQTYFRDVLTSLIELPLLQGLGDYNWSKVLRYYLEDPTSVWVEQFLGRFRYCNEYFGCSPRLVLTPLTERAFRHMSTAMHFNMGAALFGSAGTGKTETVRDFAKAIGNMCFSYNCTVNSDCRMLSQYLSGIISSGTLGCFDDFHKLTSPVLSVVIHHMQVIKMSRDAKKNTVSLSARDILLAPSSAYFITMDYELHGNTELSDIVLSTLRPCAMFEADERIISEVLLYSSGFTAATSLAKKLSTLFKLAELNLSRESHYNFGMRSIKQVIDLASYRKKVFYINWKNVCVPLETVESLLLIRCIQDFILPKLVARDQLMFKALLTDHFPALPEIFTDQSIVEKLIDEVTQEKKLEKWEPQIQKVMELFLFMKQSTGIMLVGGSGTGKTISLQILARLLDLLSIPPDKHPSTSVPPTESGNRIIHSTSTTSSSSQNLYSNNMFATYVRSKVFAAQINAKAFSLDEFYGKVDQNSTEDCIGIFPKILKSFLSDLTPSEESNDRKRFTRATKIEPREMIFEGNNVIYKSRNESDAEDSGVPLLNTTSFRAKKLSDSVLNRETSPTQIKKLSKKAKSQSQLGDMQRRGPAGVLKKSQSFSIEVEQSESPNPVIPGRLSAASKDMITSPVDFEKQIPSEWRWIVFDGPIDPEWVEHLNPALDDTKVLCLNSGERLQISEGIRFIFETESLKFANPSIVSRCSIVFFSEKDLGWKPIFNSWINSLPNSVPDKVKTYLSSLAVYSVPQAFEFLSELHNQPLPQLSCNSYINTLCNILNCLIFYLIENRTFGDAVQLSEGRQWGHHVKTSSMLSSVSVDTSYYSTTAATGMGDTKQTLSLVFEQEEEHIQPSLPQINPDVLSTIQHLPDSVMESLHREEHVSGSSLTYLQKNPDELMTVLGRLYVFAFVWAFGAPLDSYDLDEFQSPESVYSATDQLVLRGGSSGRAKFDKFVYQLFSKQGAYKISLPNSTRPIFSYYVDLDVGRFILWDSLVMEEKDIITGIPNTSYHLTTKKMDVVYHYLAKEPGSVEPAFQGISLVPTLDAVRTTFLTCLLASRGYPVILMGRHAAGISMFMRSALDLLSQHGEKDVFVSSILGGKSGSNEFENVFSKTKKETGSKFYKSEIKLFFDMSASRLQQQIESQLVKRRNKLVGRTGKKLLLFLDDINSPKSDRFNVSPCMALLSSLMDSGGLYERGTGRWRWMFDFITMGTYRLTSNSTQQLTGKFLRQFSSLLLPPPTETTIKHIFGVAVSLFLINVQFNRDIILMADNVVSAMTFLYKSACNTFKPSPSNPHYTFNIRDLAKVFLGMQQCTPEFVKSGDDLINLFTHECNRVIHDRLTDVEQKEEYFEIMHNALRIHCKVIRSPSSLQSEEILFGDFSQTHTKLSVSYQPLPPIKTISAILDEHFLRSALPFSKELPIFFDVAVQNIMRVYRVLQIPGANMIMIGLPASGKRSALSLAANLAGYEIIMPHKDGEEKSITEFDTLLKQLFRDAGLKGVKSAIYLAGRFLEQNQHILSSISYIITQGCTTQFFTNEETREIKSSISTVDVMSGHETPWHKFVSSVNANFHIFISVSQSDRILSLLCREYPDVISHCTVNHFAEWPAHARTSIAMKFLRKLETDKFVRPDILKTISTTCSDIYHGVLGRIKNLEAETCWKTYATTASFIEMLRLFSTSAKHQHNKLTLRLQQLQITVARFSQVDHEVNALSNQLMRARTRLKQKESDSEQFLKRIKWDESQCLIHRKRFEAIELDKANQAIATKDITKEATQNYEEMRPEMEEALREIHLLNKGDIVEIRLYTHPPDIVRQVMTALCLLLQQPSDWNSIKHLLANKSFIQMIIHFDKDHVSDVVLEKLQVYVRDPRFHPDNVDKVSGACKSICKWMFAIDKYCRVYRLVEPRRQDYYRSKQLEADIKEELKRAHEKLIETEKSLRRNEAAHRKALSDKRNLHTRLAKLEDKLNRANFLRTSLEEEQARCEALLEELTEKKKTFLGDCLISSAGISYLGPFPIRYRHYLLSQWIDLCRIGKIPLSPAYSFSKHLLSEEHYEIWYTQGLPRDRGSIENAVLIERGLRWPLIIDPQQLARTWIEKRESGNDLVISDYANANLSQSIALAIENRRPLLIQNIPETLPLSLDNLLLRDCPTENTDASHSNNLSEQSKDSKFRLYMTCNLPFPRFAPYVYIRTNVINFSISDESMEDLLLTEAVALEEPELNFRRVNLLKSLPSCYEELWAINESIDNLLQLEVFTILDNVSHTNTLASNLNRRRLIQIHLDEARVTQDDLNKVKSEYGEIAKRGSLLYSIACDLAQLDHMYQFSIGWFIQLFNSCFKSAVATSYTSYKFSRSLSIEERKISHLLDNLTYTFYLQIGRAIFSEHLLPFSLTLCAQLLINSPQSEECSLTNEEWNFFLYGHTSGVISDESSKTTSNISRLLLPGASVTDSRGRITPTKSSIPVPHGLSELTNEMWKRCEELEKQLPQAFISLRQYITLNTRMWKIYLADRHPFTFHFDPLNLTELPNPELEIIEEERESEDSEERDYNRTSIRRSRTSPLMPIPSISSPIPMTYECDFEPDFLTYFHKLILVKELRRESLDASIRSFISQTIGTEYIQTPVVDFNEVFSGGSTSTESNLNPILLIYSHDCTSYKDMSGDLEQLAESKLGSAAKLTHLVFIEQRVSQGFAVLKREAMRGGWVLCTNVHLQLTWLTNIIEHLMQMSRHGQKVHPNFRLWLTTKACNNFPISILHHSLKLRIESLKNLKVSMKETLLDRGAISHLDLEDQGAGPYWRRVLFTLCFFNTFIRCRNRYKKLGWNYVYDFGIRDFKCAKYVVHKLMTDHSSIPWHGIIESLSDTCYGGRIIDQKDSQRLECILAQFFNADVTTPNFKFLKNSINFPMISDDSSFEEWKSHIEQLPVNDSPESLGILRSADVMHSLNNANSLLQHLCEINHTAAGTGRSGLARDAVMQKSSVIFNSLPSKTVLPDLGNGWSTRGMDSISLSEMETGYDSNSPDSSLLMVLSREIEMYQKLLDLISSSIEELQYSRNSNVLMSSEMEGLYHDIKHDLVPRHWRCLCYPTTRKLASFILDLKQRCKFFSDWQELLSSPRTPDGSGTSSPIPPKEMFSRPRSFWLGAFFYPNSFLTALKQHFCRQRKLPLESIQFQTRILIERRASSFHGASLSQIDEAASGFTPGHEVHSGALVHGLYLEGCRWDTHHGGLTTLRGTSPISRLPPIHFIPLLKEKKISRKLFYYKMPVYHTSERTIAHLPSCRGGFNEFNFVTHIVLPSLKSPDLWCLTNAAILLSPPSYATSP